MTPKDVLTNPCFCPMPWTGLMYNSNGQVKNCIRSAGPIGNIKDNTIQDILTGTANQQTQNSMLNQQPGPRCHPCYELEVNKQKSFDIISDRVFYIKELKRTPMETYRVGNHELSTVDVRWSNLCNFSCVYCGPEFSSKWADELKRFPQSPSPEQLSQFKEYIFDHVDSLKHVYLAGGEPLLIKENLELLNILKSRNPGISIRVNTNLSNTGTKIFDMLCEFENVHWTVSVETQSKEFEYIRHGGKWEDFLGNLSQISKLGHKISFNMLYFLLNYRSLFDCVDFLQELGYHNNSFIIGALLNPVDLNIRHLPDDVLESIKVELQQRINLHPGFLLEDSYNNLLRYVSQPFEKNPNACIDFLQRLDQQRNLNSKEIFTDLYNLLEGNYGKTI